VSAPIPPDFRRPFGANYTSADMERLRQLRGRRCEEKTPTGERCPEAFRLEFAHVGPTGLCGRGRGLNWRVLDILKHPECYRLVCQAHHRTLEDADRARLREIAREGESHGAFSE
jgi:hypothetical protein